MQNCSSITAPIVKGKIFSINQCPQTTLEQKEMKIIPYASKVESLMYAQVSTRLDIALAVRMLGRYQKDLGMEHWKAAKRVMRYLQGTKDYKLTYKYSNDLEVKGYADLDFAKCMDSRKFTLGYILF